MAERWRRSTRLMEMETGTLVSIAGLLVSLAGLAWGIISFLLKRINGVGERLDEQETKLRAEIAVVEKDVKDTNKRINDLVKDHLTK